MSNSQGIRKLSPYIVIALFFVYKLTHLNISFFWDESWVYAPALQAMAANGPSLLPDAISLDYSRGHPLLFHFLGGLWISVFSSSFFSMHFFALLISIFYLLLCTALLQKLGNWVFSTLVLVLLCAQAIFVAQSSMVLPEMLLACFSMAAIYFYIVKRTWLYLIFSILAVLTKETGIIVLASIVLYDFINNLQSRAPLPIIFKRGLILSLPLLTLIAHMLYLKSVFGWYLYPEHTGLMKSDLATILALFVQAMFDQIAIQGRFLITIPFVLLYAFQLLRSEDFKNIILLILTLLISTYAWVFYGEQYALVACFMVFITHYSLTKFVKGSRSEKSFLLFLVFLLAYALFSAANFYTVRYLMSTFFFALILPIYFCFHFFTDRKWPLLFFACTIPVFVSLLLNPRTVKDINLSYLDYCPLQLEVVDYFEDNELYGEEINTMFLMSVALKDQLAGYRSTEETFQFVNQENGKDRQYYIFYSVEDDHRRDGFEGDLIKRLESGNVWFEIWRSEVKKKE